MSSTSPLTTVDSLRITFLVDNCIEWMTKLPPGFTHEMRQHISSAKLDPRTNVPIIDFENFCCGAHGFSALIETQIAGSKSHFTLFDTGPDSRSLIRNVAGMQTPLADIDRVVVSHWHRDHTGGLLSFLKLRGEKIASESEWVQASYPSCIVDVHPDRPIARGISVPPTYDKIICRLPDDPTFEQIQEVGGTVELHREGHAVADGTVWVSGEIPRVTEYEGGVLGGVRWVEESGDGKWTKDETIMDERYAAVDIFGKGLVVFSACSHAGIVNVVKDVVEKFSRPIYMIIGGLHLAGPELAPRIPLTVDFLSRQLRPAPTYILPMHCSGFNAKVALQAAFGEGCVPAGVGIRIDVKGDRERDKELFPPVC